MSPLLAVLALSKQLDRMRRARKRTYVAYCESSAEGNKDQSAYGWTQLTRIDHEIAVMLEAIHVVTQGAYHAHIYDRVDSREKAPGVPKEARA